MYLASPIVFVLNGGFRWIGKYAVAFAELLAGDISPKRPTAEIVQGIFGKTCLQMVMLIYRPPQ